MAKELKKCDVVLYKEDGSVKAKYYAVVGYSEDAAMEKYVPGSFDLGDDQSKADDVYAAIEAAIKASESID